MPTGQSAHWSVLITEKTKWRLWPRHLSHLPAVSISLSAISLSQLRGGTPTRHSDCGSWQSYNGQIETFLLVSSGRPLMSESRANATIYKAKSKDLGTRPRPKTWKLSLRTPDVVEEVSQPVIDVVRSQSVQVCGGVMNEKPWKSPEIWRLSSSVVLHNP